MQMMTTPQRPFYKGNMHLRVRSHVGVIAFGNALGNSIVSGLSKPAKMSSALQDELNAKKPIFGQSSGVSDAEIALTLGKTRKQMATDLNSTNKSHADFDAAYSNYSFGHDEYAGDVSSSFNVTNSNTLSNTTGQAIIVANQVNAANIHNRGVKLGQYKLQLQNRLNKGNMLSRMNMAQFDRNAAIGVAGGIVDMNDDVTRRAWAMNQKDEFGETVKTAVAVTAALALPVTMVGSGIGAGIATFSGKGLMPWGFGVTYGLNGGVSAGINLAFDSGQNWNAKLRNAAVNFTLGGITGSLAAPVTSRLAGSVITSSFKSQLVGNVSANVLVDASVQLITNESVDFTRLGGVALTSGLGFVAGEGAGAILSRTSLGKVTPLDIENSLGTVFGNVGRDISKNLIPKLTNVGKTYLSGSVGTTLYRGTESSLKTYDNIVQQNLAMDPYFRLYHPGKI